MKKFTCTLLLLLMASVAYAQAYYRNWTVQNNSTQERIALIIANNHYVSNGRLTQPIPTAERLETTLNGLGFDVLVGRDLNRSQMVSIVGDFADRYQNYRFAMIAYMGHGFEIDGKNYLIPIDADPPSKDEVAMEAVDLTYLLKKVNNPSVPKVIILDACRDNPFAYNWSSADRSAGGSGFADVSAPRNAEIFFTTQKNSKVRDDNPYMSYFMDEMNKRGCMTDIVREVSKKIYNHNANQIPAKYGQLLDKVCLGNAPDPTPSPDPTPDPSPSVTRETLEDWYQRGKGYYDAKDYENALYWYRKAAEQGNSTAQSWLGYMYRNGYGVAKDYDKAVYWYRKAAEQGNSTAQSWLGYMYRNGYGVAKDYDKAVYWYRKAAEQGYANGQTNLGWMYESGKGVDKDLAKAVYWYRKAAEQGDANGQNWLGYMYQKGYGVTQDYEKAVSWYRKADEQGDANGQNNLGWMYQYGYGVAKDYDKAVSWYRKAAEQGYASGQYNLGYMYRNGYGVAKDYDKAVYWYKKACDNGNETACTSLRNLGE